MRVLVPDHGHVEVAVDARRVEGAGDRLPQVHVRDRRLPSGDVIWFALSRAAKPEAVRR